MVCVCACVRAEIIYYLCCARARLCECACVRVCVCQRRRNVFKIGGADFVKLLATIFIANHVEGGAYHTKSGGGSPLQV